MGRKPQNIKGLKIGHLKAIEPLKERSHGYIVWKWQCKFCHNYIYATKVQVERSENYVNGRYHCTCQESKKNILSKHCEDNTGLVIGSLRAVAATGEIYEASGNVIWSWECLKCGNKITGTKRQIKRSERSGKYRCNCK